MKLRSYYLWIFPVVLLALAGLIWSRPKPVSANKVFDIHSFRGRFISAENAFDVSSDHAFTADCPGCVGGPIFFATAEVIQSDGAGFVCGGADGFYGGQPPPGVNLGPSYFHGTYTVRTDGRTEIHTCKDSGTPTAICTAADELAPCCDPSAPIVGGVECKTKVQVGYLKGDADNEVDTVEQVTVGFPDGTGFLVHQHRWERANGDN